MTTKEQLESLAQIVNQGADRMAHIIASATGMPIKAVIVIVHFPEDIVFGNAMQEAPPQAQMNAIDLMMKHCKTFSDAMKVRINSIRHGAPKDPEQTH